MEKLLVAIPVLAALCVSGCDTGKGLDRKYHQKDFAKTFEKARQEVGPEDGEFLRDFPSIAANELFTAELNNRKPDLEGKTIREITIAYYGDWIKRVKQKITQATNVRDSVKLTSEKLEYSPQKEFYGETREERINPCESVVLLENGSDYTVKNIRYTIKATIDGSPGDAVKIDGFHPIPVTIEPKQSARFVTTNCHNKVENEAIKKLQSVKFASKELSLDTVEIRQANGEDENISINNNYQLDRLNAELEKVEGKMIYLSKKK